MPIPENELIRRAEELLRYVPEDGSTIGNNALRQTLANRDPGFWGIEENYREVRDYLIERGELVPGPRRGGTVRRPPSRRAGRYEDDECPHAARILELVPEDGSWISWAALHQAIRVTIPDLREDQSINQLLDCFLEKGILNRGPGGGGGKVRRAPMFIDPSLRAQQMLDKVRPDGNFMPNTELWDALIELDGSFWGNKEYYWAVRNYLVDNGTLVIGKGRGGSVARTPAAEEEPELPAAENQLYEGLLNVLHSDWAQDARYSACVTRLTAHARRTCPGKWSCPDISMLGCIALSSLGSCAFDVVTFEVKRAEAIDVTAVYESLEHRSYVHLAYLIVVQQDGRAGIESRLEPIKRAAREHGIGLILCGGKNDAYKKYDTWEESVPA